MNITMEREQNSRGEGVAVWYLRNSNLTFLLVPKNAKYLMNKIKVKRAL